MKRYTIAVNGTPYDVVVEEAGAVPASAAVPVPSPAPAAAPAPAGAPVGGAPAANGGDGSIPITAPMPGSVLEVKVSVGQAVNEGDVLLIMEAMKMENEIVAPHSGTIASIRCAKGDMVNAGDLFLTMN